ncbi:MAG: magnesium transporter [Alphaproteobacteria bacterium]|nr:magnesium transporter [Alphaproteobacteria bacterium]
MTEEGRTPDSAARPRHRDGESGGLQQEQVRAIVDAIDQSDAARLTELTSPLHAADKADLLEVVGADQRAALFDLWRPDLDPDVLAHLVETVRDALVPRLTREELVRAVDHLDTDDAVYVIEGLDPAEQQELLDAIPAPDRAALREGLTFEEDSAGRLMQRELVAVPAYWSVGHIIDYLRASDDLPDEFYDVFIIDPQHRPVGTIRLSRLVRNQRSVMVRDLMDRELRLVPSDMDQEEVAYLFSQYGLASAPVVDRAGRLIGVITHDDVAEVIAEEAEEDILHLGGVGETDFHDSVFRTSRKRFLWLFCNLGTALSASFVISLFHETIAELVALAALMPIVAAIGGNAGTQAMTVAVRALATRDLAPTNAFRSVRKEVLVAIINGVLCAVLMGAITWVRYENWELAGVMAVAMVANLMMAGFSGALIPVTLARVGVDPAPAAGVFITAITDMVGFFVFLGLAFLLLT